jgi:dTMP kinase
MPALVVSIEGTDFSGKSTVANLLVEILRKKYGKKITFRRTELPSTLVTGFFTKILRNSVDSVSPQVFSLTYALDHLHHFKKVIEPLKNSKENFVVIQERSFLSCLVYQGIIGNVDLDWLEEINKFNKNVPDLTLILKVDIEELLRRKALEMKDFDKFEVRDHLEKEVKVYYNLPPELAKLYNVQYVDANRDVMVVARDCAERIQKKIEEFFK